MLRTHVKDSKLFALLSVSNTGHENPGYFVKSLRLDVYRCSSARSDLINPSTVLCERRRGSGSGGPPGIRSLSEDSFSAPGESAWSKAISFFAWSSSFSLQLYEVSWKSLWHFILSSSLIAESEKVVTNKEFLSIGCNMLIKMIGTSFLGVKQAFCSLYMVEINPPLPSKSVVARY